MKVNFVTRTGSVYQLNSDKMTWERLSKSDESGLIKAEKGELVSWPTVEVGRSVFLMDKNTLHVPDGMQSFHWVHTSPVVAVEDTSEESNDARQQNS